MSLDIKEFQDYLKIDQGALDREIVQQPSLFFRVSEEYAKAQGHRDYLKEMLARVDAEVAHECRAKIEKDGERATDAKVSAAVLLHKDHVKAFKGYNNAKENVDMLSALKDAFVQRGYMLRELCSLYVSNYFEKDAVAAKGDAKDVVYKKQRQRLSEKREKRKAK